MADSATQTCFCGDVSVRVPTSGDAVGFRFICHCNDCHRFTASLMACNYCIKDENVEFVKGKDLVSTYTKKEEIESGYAMTNHFCKQCGSLIFRRAENPALKGWSILRCGGLDDVKLRDTVFKPTMELFTKYREDWLPQVPGLDQHEAMP